MFWRPVISSSSSSSSNRKRSTADSSLTRGFEPPRHSSVALLWTLTILAMCCCCCFCLSSQQEPPPSPPPPLPQPPSKTREQPQVVETPAEQTSFPVREEAELDKISIPVQKLDSSMDCDLADKVRHKVTGSTTQWSSFFLAQRTMTSDTRFRSTEHGHAGRESASRAKRSTSTKHRRELITVRRHASKPFRSSFKTRRPSSEAQGPSSLEEGPTTSVKDSVSSFLGETPSFVEGVPTRFGNPTSYSTHAHKTASNTSLELLPSLADDTLLPRSPASPHLKYHLPHRRLTSLNDRTARLEENHRIRTRTRHRLRHERHHHVTTASQPAAQRYLGRSGGGDDDDSSAMISRISHFRRLTGCGNGQKLPIGRHSNRPEAARRRRRMRVEGREPVESNGSASSASAVSLNISASSSAAVQCLVLSREMTLLFCSAGEGDLFLTNASFSSNLSSDCSFSSSSSCSSSASSFSSLDSSSYSSSSPAFSSSVSLHSNSSQIQSSSLTSSSSTSSSSSSSSSFKRRIQFLSILRPRFCDHLRSLDVLHLDFDLELVHESNCVQSLSSLQDADDQAAEIYAKFERLLGQFDCDDQYSVRWNCEHCKTAYKNWLCAIKLPIFYYYGVGRTKQLPACRVFSEMVEEKCPYLSPHSQMQYAGEPAFSSLGAGSELTEDGDCYFLCGDDIARSMMKGSSVRNATDRVCIHYGINQAESL